MKYFWLLPLGLWMAVVVGYVQYVLSNLGEVRPGYTIGVDMIIPACFIMLVPMFLGFLSGVAYEAFRNTEDN